jgi:hypothetical protein
MHTHEIQLTGAREAASEARDCLFSFPEVLDVLVTSRPDSLVVVFAGRPRPAEWSARLRAAGMDVIRPSVRRRPERIAARQSPSRPPAPAGRTPRPRSLRRPGHARLVAVR